MSAKKEIPMLYEIKIVLMRLDPAIWRRVQVPRDITLENLHHVIQGAMGWQEGHLHDFCIHDKHYGPRVPDLFGLIDLTVNEKIVHLNGVAKPKATFTYEYDFGDGWEHEIHIERELESTNGQRQAVCIAGEYGCPPEDCGGPPGYQELNAILSDPQHEGYDELREWAGEDFDPLHFDIELANRRLSAIRL